MSKAMYSISGKTGVLISAWDDKPVDFGLFYDERDAISHAYRKRDWHTNKGKRRVKKYDGYLHTRYDEYV